MHPDDHYRGEEPRQRVAWRVARDAQAGASSAGGPAFLDRSIAWVRTFPDATNHDVPADLRDAWILPEETSAEDRKAVLTIFLAGYTATKALGGKQRDACAAISATEVSDQFENWQLKLILAKLNAGGGPKSSPVALFGIRDEEIRVTV